MSVPNDCSPFIISAEIAREDRKKRAFLQAGEVYLLQQNRCSPCKYSIRVFGVPCRPHIVKLVLFDAEGPVLDPVTTHPIQHHYNCAGQLVNGHTGLPTNSAHFRRLWASSGLLTAVTMPEDPKKEASPLARFFARRARASCCDANALHFIHDLGGEAFSN